MIINATHFILINYSSARIQPQSVVDMPSGTPLETSDFSFSGMYQLQTTLWLGMGLCVFSTLGFHQVWSKADLVHAVTVSWRRSASVLLCLVHAVTMESSSISDSYSLSASSSREVPEAWRKSLIKTTSIWLNTHDKV